MNEFTVHPLDPIFASMPELAPTDEEVARAVAADHARRAQARRRRSLTLSTAAAVIVAGGASYAVPATRAAVNDAYATIESWASGDDDTSAPGRAPAAGEQLPGWLPDKPGDTRVIAQTAGVKLVAVRESGDRLSLALGNSVGLTESVDHWRQRLAGTSVALVGPAAFPDGRSLDGHGRRPLLGLVAPAVRRVELRYATGEATSSQDELTGGFVLLVKADEPLRELVAFDSTGRAIGRLDVSDLDLRVCFEVNGCQDDDAAR